MNRVPKCFIWGTRAIEIYAARSDSGGIQTAAICESPRAGGKYWISDQAQYFFSHPDQFNWIDKALKTRLTTWLMKQRAARVDCPKIHGRDIGNFQNKPGLLIEQRAKNLLAFADHLLTDEADSFVIGTTEPENPQGWEMEMLAWCESTSREQVHNLLDHLGDLRYLERLEGPSPANLYRCKYRIMAEGHRYLERRRQQSNPAVFFTGVDVLPDALDQG